METSIALRYPTIAKRVQSIFVDLLFIVILMFAAAKIIDLFGDAPDWVRIVLFLGLWGVYEPFCTAYACTIGNYLLKIRVRKINHPSERINLFQAYMRYIFKSSLGWLSFLTVHTNEERRAIHDLVAGSVMIEL